METLQHFLGCFLVVWVIFHSSEAQISKLKSSSTIVYKPNATQVKVGVILISDNHSPFDIERAGPAIDIAFEKVNNEILNASFSMTQVRKVYGNICDAATAPGVAADLHYGYEVVGLIGPGCSEALDPVARMSYFWNRPIVTGAGGSGMFFYKENYRTLTRLAYCECRMRRVIQTVLEAYNWTKIALIVDRDDAFGLELGQSLDSGLQKNGYFPYVNSIYGRHDPALERILRDTSYSARIIILCMPGDLVRQTLLAAWDMGLIQTGEYVFIDVEMFPFPGDYFGNHTWARGDDRDADARRAFDAVLRITLKYAIDESNTGFVEEVKKRALRDYGFEYGDEEVNFLVATFHDAVLLFGITINETLYAGGNFSNGRALTEIMMHRYIDGVSGRFYMDGNSDRLTDFIIQDTDALGTYTDVAYIFGDNLAKLHWNQGQKMHWAGGLVVPPRDVPFCGFRGENILCKVKEPLSPIVIALVAILAIVTVGLLLASFMYRKMKLESALKDLSWLIPADAVTAVKNAGAASMATLIRSSRPSVTKDTVDGLSQKQEQYFIEIGNYRSQVVAMRKISKTNIDINRQLQMEVKMRRETTNENVTKFIGAIFEPTQTTLIIEYCQKGSLQDIIMNDSINLDAMFKTSLIEDMTKGMRYIHSSPIGFHGKLTSSNCVVDSRFMLKITDFGLPTFYDRSYPMEMTKKDSEETNIYSDLYWTAPEILRNTINQKDIKEKQKADVYSFGIILQEIALRNMPFSDELDSMSAKEVIGRVIAQENPPFRPNVDGAECAPWIVDMFRTCVEDTPSKRPDFAALRNTVRATNKGQEINIMDNLLKRMEMYANNLETIVAERTDLLVQEQKKTEQLLLQILPKSIADQLKQGKHVAPETFDSVSIYFSDVVGFTSISAASTPLQIVDLLNDLYTCFDSTIGSFDVYKVETIGDAYMVASGVPISNGNRHAAEISRMSLALLDSIGKFKMRHRPDEKLKLRIGLHSGSVVAGVVGLKMPRYCLFGDTVNTASRMESNGEALKIHLSESIKVILDTFGNFKVEERGEIPVKGKGTMKTYWLLGSD